MHGRLLSTDADLREAAPATLALGCDLERVHAAVKASLAAYAICRVFDEAAGGL